MDNTRQALNDFTRRFIQRWQQETGHEPQSEELYGIPSSCIVRSAGESVQWLPQPFVPAADLSAVERALDIVLRPEAHDFYTAQYAGDMPASHRDLSLTLLQTWSEDDFRRVQENLIGHLVMQKRLKLSPTLFLATTGDEMETVALCNLSGEVILEKVGTRQRETLAPSLETFLEELIPRVF
ncbi:SecY-interacting protein [Entomohabitans teleogrylli]|uniref:SecY-interacting protein n=1 Tax=Entomohabitans teleogrylli TaxID=1384589 RepID=UPI00073D1B62|nr:SecY-interacting protein [Entomohabitans teleogrylli]